MYQAQFQKPVFLTLGMVNVTPPGSGVKAGLIHANEQCMPHKGRVEYGLHSTKFFWSSGSGDLTKAMAQQPVLLPSRDPIEVIVTDVGR